MSRTNGSSGRYGSRSGASPDPNQVVGKLSDRLPYPYTIWEHLFYFRIKVCLYVTLEDRLFLPILIKNFPTLILLPRDGRVPPTFLRSELLSTLLLPRTTSSFLTVRLSSIQHRRILSPKDVSRLTRPLNHRSSPDEILPLSVVRLRETRALITSISSKPSVHGTECGQ